VELPPGRGGLQRGRRAAALEEGRGKNGGKTWEKPGKNHGKTHEISGNLWDIRRFFEKSMEKLR